VYAIVFAELALFVGFGATQFAQFAQFDRDVYAERRRGNCGNCGDCGNRGSKCKCAKRRERRRGSEKKETTTKSENEDETDETARCVCGTAAAPAGYDRAARARALARVEAAYIVQSFVSKTLLGWLTYAGNFA